MYLISVALILEASVALMVPDLLPYMRVGSAKMLYNLILVFRNVDLRLNTLFIRLIFF